MILKDLLQNIPEEILIARAIFEDKCKPEKLYKWITKYYAQLVRLKSAEICASKEMLYFSVHERELSDGLYGMVSGFHYDDIKAGIKNLLALECSKYSEYVSLYVPDYTVRRYGEEVVASEALREYGWNGFDTGIICPDEMRLAVLRALDDMETKLFPTDRNYYERCREQFRCAYEGREVPQWEDAEQNDRDNTEE